MTVNPDDVVVYCKGPQILFGASLKNSSKFPRTKHFVSIDFVENTPQSNINIKAGIDSSNFLHKII